MAGFRQFIRQTLSQGDGAPPSVLQVGLHRSESEDNPVWLVRRVLPWSEALREADPGTQWIVSTRPDPPGEFLDIPPFASGRLDLGRGLWSDYAWGAIRDIEGIRSLDVLDLIGPGLQFLRLTPNREAPGDILSEALNEEVNRDRRSRTIGALGGEAVWRRLVSRRVALVGVGRTGSLIATGLARLGLRELVLIDPDLVEPHNLGEMDGVTQIDIGRPKVDALADELRRIQDLPTMSVTALAMGAETPEARRAIADCEIVIAAVDQDPARLIAGWSALEQHQVLLDIGTGVLHSPQAEMASQQVPSGDGRPYARLMGTDVRLILPGDGCLSCCGGVVRYHEALETLAGAHRARAVNRSWNQERAGSLRSMNQIAAGVALQMLQDLAEGRITQSRWTRIEFDVAGRINSTDLPTRNPGEDSSSCPSCIRAGRGDITLGLV